jgi:hypothetical protein
MNKRKLFQWAVLGYMMLTGMTACSSDDDTTDITDDGVKVRRITITQTDDAAARQMLTRSTLVESDGLTASWTAGDGLTYCNLSRTNPMNYEIYTGPLTAASTASTSQFTGNVTCNAGDYLAVVYPAATFVTNESYTISLSGQDGTLGTLATNYHYVYGKAYVTSVTDNTANATMEKMKSLLTVCKFSFVDKTTGAAIPIKTLAISYGGSGSDARTYPQTATVTLNSNGILEQSAVHAAGTASTSSLLVDCSVAFSLPSEGLGEVFVALLPTSGQRTFNFTVANSSGTYTGTAKATLVEGEYIVATGLKLTKNN